MNAARSESPPFPWFGTLLRIAAGSSAVRGRGVGILARCRPEDLRDSDTIAGTTRVPRTERDASAPRIKPPRSCPLGTRGSAPAASKNASAEPRDPSAPHTAVQCGRPGLAPETLARTCPPPRRLTESMPARRWSCPRPARCCILPDSTSEPFPLCAPTPARPRNARHDTKDRCIIRRRSRSRRSSRQYWSSGDKYAFSRQLRQCQQWVCCIAIDGAIQHRRRNNGLHGA